MSKYFNQADQVRGYAGLNNGGTEQYATVQDLFNEKAFMGGVATVLAMAVASSVAVLGAGTFPTGLVHLDGSSSKSMNGGLALATYTTNGTHDMTTALVAGAESNVWTVLDKNDDDLITPQLQRVFAIATTELVDGVTGADDKIQLSFVVRDTATNGWKEYVLPIGNYQYVPNRVWSVGSAIANGTYGALLSSSVGARLTEVVEGYGELLSQLPKADRTGAYIHIDTFTTLPVDNLVVMTVVANVPVFKDSAGTVISGTVVATDGFALTAEMIAGVATVAGAESANGWVHGMEMTVGGLELAHDVISMSGAGELTFDLSDVITTGLYKDTRLSVRL